MHTHPRILTLAACLALALACTKDDGDDSNTTASTTAASDAGTGEPSTAGPATGEPATTDPGTTTDEPTTAAGPTTTPSTDPSAGETTDPSATDPSAGETTDPSAGETTGPAPTDGPGVLPGETGIDSFCRRYVECGGTYYADEQGCLDATFNYWGECPSRRAALDKFGACMSELDCSEWNPDAYNPGSTPCAGQWSDLQRSPAC